MDKYAQLLAELTSAGVLGEEWRGAFERAPRSAFVPDTVWAPDTDHPTGYRRITRSNDPTDWWALVNANDVVVTQLDDGAEDGPGTATSSASMPSLVATMLRHLDAADGHTVLDIGTGTGWTSALLSARLGEQRVTTIEVDQAMAAGATSALAKAGFDPTRIIGDGLAGWLPNAPYDRIHSTAAVQTVPRAWIDQTTPGGIIVTPWGTPFANAGLLRLVIGEHGQPTYGRFVDNVTFMWMRAQRPHRVTDLAEIPSVLSASPMDPRMALEDVDAAFTIGLRVPGVRFEHRWDTADRTSTYRMHMSDGAGSWASVHYHEWDAEDALLQAGPRRLWDEITAARLWWLEEGKPSLSQFGLTLTPDGQQTVWLNDPGNVVD
ncbi:MULTISPECIES: methyltransferase domain-containing protein [Kitasatospora]|uniref:Protein-L-isoaspartate O-methyltransferase n=1 Tax=Kitasatospora setae (strain ATCC 33774 / DSM 43861 / JCM 3304 / KCC A-0304 / NBRC 14216 / KM-6054) TaxID=452652 RepID=E4NEM0_KITSK|nr:MULTISPECIES: methyltransferase domain-containing protein [Kitasatospora]BAJ29806.1 putative methyltransferase [Kitasatospora setae KM-6054]